MFSNWKLRRYIGLIKKIIVIFTRFKKGDYQFVYDRIRSADEHMPEADGALKFATVFKRVQERFPYVGKTCCMIAIHLLLSYAKKQGVIQNGSSS